MSLDIDQYKQLISWLKDNGNPIYNNIDLDNPPEPVFLEQEINQNNTDESVEIKKENQLELTFAMPSHQTPTQSQGTYVSEAVFSKAIINSSSPTLEIQGATYEQDHKVKIEHVLPFQFPFGLGGFDELKENPISKKDYLRHLQDICLPAFCRQDFALISNHIYNQIKSFEMASLKLKSNIGKLSQAERLSTVTCEELLQAVERKEKKQYSSTDADNTLNTIEACTKEIAHSREAAISARQNMFALHDYYGCGTIFVTFSPSVGSSIRVQMFAQNCNVVLPTANACVDIDKLKADIDYHLDLCSYFPGAGVLEFRHLYDIFISKLMKWDKKKQKADVCGVYGTVTAFASAIEDQMNMPLHAHFLIWISTLDKLKKDLYSSDFNVQSTAKSAMKSYISSIISTSFGRHLPTQHSFCNTINLQHQCFDDSILDSVDNQTLQDYRSRPSCTIGKGQTIQCSLCLKKFNPTLILNNEIKRLHDQLPDNNQWKILKLPLSKEIITAITMYQPFANGITKEEFDFVTFVANINVNLHDYDHRKSCFKKGCECRFDFPFPVCKETRFVQENVNKKEEESLIPIRYEWNNEKNVFLVQIMKLNQ